MGSLNITILNPAYIANPNKNPKELTILVSNHLVGVLRIIDPIIRLDVHRPKKNLAKDSHSWVIMQWDDGRLRHAEDAYLEDAFSNSREKWITK